MRLFACDFDGTLNINGEVSRANLEAIDIFRERGGVFGIVSGRPASFAPQLLEMLPGKLDFVLCCTGAVFADADGGCEELACYCTDTAARLCAFARETGASFAGLQHAYQFCGAELDDPEADAVLGAFLQQHGRVNQTNFLYASEAAASEAAARIGERFGGLVNPQQNGDFVDVPPAGTDKAEGIRRVAERFGVSEDFIYAAGDNVNDLSMVEAFHGFAVDRGVQKLKKKAEFVVADVAEALQIILKNVG